MHALQSWYRAAPPFQLEPDVNAWILGVEYRPVPGSATGTCAEVFPGLLRHVFSLPWFSYRSKFEPVDSSPPMTTDLGWGCMLRSGQMLLAQALLVRYLGRGWRVSMAFGAGTTFDGTSCPSSFDSGGEEPMHEEILKWFYDSSSVPFSVHSISTVGVEYGTVVGQWFGPTTISQVLRDLVGRYRPSGLRVYVSSDGCLYRDRVWFDEDCSSKRDHSSSRGSDPDPSGGGVLFLIPLRLGVTKLNEMYVPLLQEFLRMPQSIGIIGGRPRSSHYFVGYQGDSIIYLDPHQLQQVSTDTHTYHTSNPAKMRFTDLDPSLAVGLYCHDEAEFEDLCTRITLSASDPEMPVVTVQDCAPEYLCRSKGVHIVGTERSDVPELEEFILMEGARAGAGAEEFEEDACFM